MANFRCITTAELQFDPKLNVLTGGNGAGKTSLLEALYFLGRARSFRTADNRVLIRSGTSEAEVSGTGIGPAGPCRLGVRIGAGGVDIHIAGQSGAQATELVSALPVQAIHADIGGIVQGPPEVRRQLLDWGVFHVKHDYLVRWRQFRRALLQRNAVLRDRGPDEMIEAWEGELASAGTGVHDYRHEYLKRLETRFQALGQRLLGYEVSLQYQRGWPEGEDLTATLRSSREADRSAGFTRAGPHRADLQFQIQSERSRSWASKGQQKLLGAALILAQCDLVAEELGNPVALLVDEPGADLDRGQLERFVGAILDTRAQVFVAAIAAEGLALDGRGTMFHVEHGHAKALL